MPLNLAQNNYTAQSEHAVASNPRPALPPKFASDSTPVKKKYGPDLTFTSEIKPFDKVRSQLAKEMDGRWLGAMPVNEFFDEFLPPADKPLPRIARNPFRKVPVGGVENSSYKPFIDAIQSWMPHLHAVNTSNKEDTTNGLKLKTDISVYDRIKSVAPPKRTDFSRMELWMEFKKTDGVAFQDPPDSEDSRLSSIEQGLFAPNTVEGNNVRGQLAHYAGAMHSVQFRHFSFSILVEGNDARFLRWDPAGTVVTAAFNYRTSPRLMAEFLWRFDQASAGERGHDESVQPANLSPEIDARVREKLGMKDKNSRLYRYTLPGLTGLGYAYGPKPPTQNRSLVSRCTRSMPVVWLPVEDACEGIKSCSQQGSSDKQETDARNVDNDERPVKSGLWDDERIIYMKDTWRFLSDQPNVEVMPEHKIYEILYKHGTPNIPEHVTGGDVENGKTRTQEFIGAAWLCVEPQVSPFQHYRLVHRVVGRALFKFDCTKQLVTGVFDALKAHAHAFEHAKLLHRDISAGNIILTDEGKGLLIDWELAKDFEEIGKRRPNRTGTWQFMSAGLLQNSGKTHTLADDLESFLHVLGWTTIRYVPANDAYDAENRRKDLLKYDEISVRRGRSDRGGEFKSKDLGSGQYPSLPFRPRKDSPLMSLLEDLAKPFKSLYRKRPPTEEDRMRAKIPLDPSNPLQVLSWASVIQYDSDISSLMSSTLFIDTIKTALDRNDWPADDRADETLPIALSSRETDNRIQIKASQLKNTHNVWANSQGVSSGSKRLRDPAPDSSAKRRRVTPAGSESGPVVS